MSPGNVGTFTLVYDEGFEVTIDSVKYFAFFRYEPKKFSIQKKFPFLIVIVIKHLLGGTIMPRTTRNGAAILQFVMKRVIKIFEVVTVKMRAILVKRKKKKTTKKTTTKKMRKGKVEAKKKKVMMKMKKVAMKQQWKARLIKLIKQCFRKRWECIISV